MHHEWQTPARQKLVVEIDRNHALSVSLISYKGEELAVPVAVLSHLNHWWRAACLIEGVDILASAARSELQASTAKYAQSAPSGLCVNLNNLCHHQQNANTMRSICDVALSRALSAADKAMLDGQSGRAISGTNQTEMNAVFMAPECLSKPYAQGVN
jgi:hypothetical protein